MNIVMENSGHSIKADSVGVKFFLTQQEKRKKKEFWALKDISFTAEKGEIFGIVGSNGAGKSTLLKVIAGIYPTTRGSVAIKGSIAPLIELGAAINPELTGAENIFLAGSIYRIPKSAIKEQFDKIVDFSGLKKFINIPVKNYSSGMFIRLAFSTIIFFQPDVILIDEVFSVGDEIFQKKSFEKILSFRRHGATILLVTHDAKLITQICDRALILSEGRMSFLGSAKEAVDHYHQLIKGGEGLETDVRLPQKPPPQVEATKWGNKQVEIKTVDFMDAKGKPKEIFKTGDYFEARIAYASHLEDERPIFGVAINTIYKLLIYGPNTLETKLPEKIPNRGIVRFIIPKLPLLEGNYLFSAAAYDKTLKNAYDHHDMMYHFRVLPDRGDDFGSVRIRSEWEIEGN